MRATESGRSGIGPTAIPMWPGPSAGPRLDSGPVVDVPQPSSVLEGNLTNGKALTIQADVGGGVFVHSTPDFGGQVAGLPAGKSVRLRGLAMNQIRLANNGGTVWMENCLVLAEYTGSQDAIVVTSSSDVVLLNTSATGTAGLRTCVDPFEYLFNFPGAGLLVSGGSNVAAYGCRFQGGDGGSHETLDFIHCTSDSGAAGVRSLSLQDKLFLSDCLMTGGSCDACRPDQLGCLCPHAGHGVDAAGETFLLDSVAKGGIPARPNLSHCDAATPGSDLVGAVQTLPGKALRASVASPVHENESISIHIEGPAFVPVWLVRAAAPHSMRQIRGFRGVLLLDWSTWYGLTLLGVTDATGTLDRALPAGALPRGSMRAWTSGSSPTWSPRGCPTAANCCASRRSPRSSCTGKAAWSPCSAGASSGALPEGRTGGDLAGRAPVPSKKTRSGRLNPPAWHVTGTVRTRRSPGDTEESNREPLSAPEG